MSIIIFDEYSIIVANKFDKKCFKGIYNNNISYFILKK